MVENDLKKIRKTNFQYEISNNPEDFEKFYSTMYLPYVQKRFGAATITKSRNKMSEIWRNGFLFFLLLEGNPVAEPWSGSKKKKYRNSAWDSGWSRGLPEMGVTGAIYYHLLDWRLKTTRNILT